MYSTKDLTIMAIFAAIGAAFILTTMPLSLILPVRIPGIFGLIAVPASTIFLLTARGLVGKPGAGTITGFIMGVVQFLLPGGPNILAIPTSLLFGLIIDIFLLAINKNIEDSRWIAAGAAFLPSLFTPWLMYWGFSFIFGRIIPIHIFLAIFLGLHGALRVGGGLVSYDTLKRLKS